MFGSIFRGILLPFAASFELRGDMLHVDVRLAKGAQDIFIGVEIDHLLPLRFSQLLVCFVQILLLVILR